MLAPDVRDAYVRTCVVVPAYNEGPSIEKVILAIGADMPGATGVVGNDGSTDDTEERARAAGALVLSLVLNLGIGGAVQTGYQYAMAQGFDYAIQIDGDGQHEPSEAHHLLTRLLADDVDIVIGSRWLGRGNYVAPRNRRFGMKFLESLVSLRAGARFTDTTSGFRALNRRAIALFARHYPTDYPEVESILLARHYGLEVREVPVMMKAREHGHSSIRGLRTLYFMVRITIALLLGVVGGESS